VTKGRLPQKAGSLGLNGGGGCRRSTPDKTCELLDYRKLHKTTTREQLWQYSLLLLTKSQLRRGQMAFNRLCSRGTM